jgi:uncharacterized RDD family membrane protein YckC
MSNPYAPPRAAVQDIVNDSARASAAERSVRLGAALLDGLVVIGMVYVPLFVGMLLGGVLKGADGGGAMLGVGFAPAIIGFVVWCTITVRYMQRNGQSIGKKMVGIKVVRTNGEPATFGRLFWLRNFVNAAIGMIPLYAFVDLLFIFGESRQCLHDKIADTVVVNA